MSEKNFQRTQSAAVVQNGGGNQQQGTIGGSASTNQLPSPMFQGEGDLPPIYPRHSSRADASQTGKSVTTSAASFTLTSTASITSSHGTEDSEDDHRKKVLVKYSLVLQYICVLNYWRIKFART